MLRRILGFAKPPLKRALYALGPLVAYHRLKNRNRLTVVMFHRVLSSADPRWHYCDPEYTISDALLAECFAFFKRHYDVIGLPSLLEPKAALGDHPLLITFDDGWEDNERYALPVLRRAGLPAVIFVASDAVDAAQPDAFWEMWIVHAFRRGTLPPDKCLELWNAVGEPGPAPGFRSLDDCRALITRLERLDQVSLSRVLEPFAGPLASPPGDRHLLTTGQLRALAAGGVTVGGHGKSHFPLARAKSPFSDMSEGRAKLAEKLGVTDSDAPATMSFPHGSYTAETVRLARDAGYRLIFTSDPVVNELTPGEPPPTVLGRLGIEAAVITDEFGRFRPDLLALRLFRARSTVLTDRRTA